MPKLGSLIEEMKSRNFKESQNRDYEEKFYLLAIDPNSAPKFVLSGVRLSAGRSWDDRESALSIPQTAVEPY